MSDTSTTPTTIANPDDVVRVRNGVGAFGVYTEVLEYTRRGDASTPTFARHVIVFYTKNVIVTYDRQPDRKAGRWVAKKTTSLEDAHDRAVKYLARLGKGDRVAIMRGRPLLIELKASDVESIQKEEAPYARYVGQFATNSRVGKLDDSDSDGKNVPFNDAVADLAKVYAIDDVTALTAAIIDGTVTIGSPPVTAPTTTSKIPAF